jgi:hypothetical protein
MEWIASPESMLALAQWIFNSNFTREFKAPCDGRMVVNNHNNPYPEVSAGATLVQDGAPQL